ncbi:hypothetical protein HPB50_019160 [Hyalomma asiaticum]|uniref:Uncharacterized protein n=1 Tax=Hyalomma asiaticum TaxID=266040 RepID=A0ACB7T349_HYAAI|nr:hypothetical protein HPB50_019160 [Hyalomma asiaticum]
MAEAMSSLPTTTGTADADPSSTYSTQSGYTKGLDINEPSVPAETEAVPEARPRASRRRAFVQVTQKSTRSPPSASCIDDDNEESDRCGSGNDAGTTTGTRNGGTSRASESNEDGGDVSDLTVVPSVEWLQRSKEGLTLPTMAGTNALGTTPPVVNDETDSPNGGGKPKSELRTKDSAAKGSKAEGQRPKRTGKKDKAGKGRSSSGRRAKGSAKKNPITKGPTTEGTAAKAPKSKSRVTKHVTKQGRNEVERSTPQGPTAAARPVRTSPPLICAYGNWTSVDTSFPEDGLCDYAFFDALYRGRAQESDVARLGRMSAALRHFLAGTRRYRRTQNGVATSYKGLKWATKDMDSSRATSDMRALWKNGVRHLGVLDFIPGAETTETEVERLFKFLQLCRKLQDKAIPKNALPKASLALGITFLSSNRRQVYANVEKHLRSGWSPSRHKIELVVLRTHLSGRDDTVPSCTITGSSVWGRTLADYQPSMVDSLDYMEKKLKPMSSESLFFISMSAAVRRYVPAGQDDKAKSFEPGSRCRAYDESDYAREVDNFALVCDDAEYTAHIKRDEVHETMYSYRLNPRSAVTFDSEDTIFAKMCKARKMMSSVPYGLALFDAEFDDTSNECATTNKFGNFTLVRAARRAVDYVYGPTFNENSQCSQAP